VKAAGALLLGRVTYEGFASVWPGRIDEMGFADKMNAMPTFVLSTTQPSAVWDNSTVISAHLTAAVRLLTRDVRGDLLVAGSCQLVHALTARDLLDECRLTVFTVLLGARSVCSARALARRVSGSSRARGQGSASS